MDSLILVARLALAAVFVAAALGKLVDRDGSRRAAERFGVSTAFAGLVGLGLPLAELAIAAGLILAVSAAWAALAAAALLIAFCAAIARLLARGEAPPCNCFGSIGTAPVSRGTLVRNAGLLALAGFVAVTSWNGGGSSVSELAADLGAATIVLGLAIVSVAAFSWQLFQQNGRLLDRVSKLETAIGRSSEDDRGRPLTIGEPAPRFALPDLDGRPVSLDDLLRSGRGALLVFTDPACAACDPLLPAIGRFRGEHETPVAMISRGPLADNQAKAQEHGIAPMLLQEDLEVAEAYRVFGFPAAIQVDPAGRIGGQRAGGAQAVAELLQAGPTPELRLVRVSASRSGAYERTGQA